MRPIFAIEYLEKYAFGSNVRPEADKVPNRKLGLHKLSLVADLNTTSVRLLAGQRESSEAAKRKTRRKT